jgi:hypothetical protein
MPVRDGAGGERRDEGAVAERVAHTVRTREDAPGRGALAARSGSGQVGAAIDHRDLHRGRGASTHSGTSSIPRRLPLPLPGDARLIGLRKRRFVDSQRPAQNWLRADRVPRLDDCDAKLGQRPDDPRPGALELGERAVRHDLPLVRVPQRQLRSAQRAARARPPHRASERRRSRMPLSALVTRTSTLRRGRAELGTTGDDARRQPFSGV